MCFGAILISGIRRIVFAYEDVMGGGTRCDLSRMPPLYGSRPVHLVPHVLRDKSLFLFKSFFSNPDNTYWKDSLLAAYTLVRRFLCPDLEMVATPIPAINDALIIFVDIVIHRLYYYFKSVKISQNTAYRFEQKDCSMLPQ